MLTNCFTFLRRHFGFFVVFVGAYMIAVAPLGIGNDGLVRYASLDALLRDGTLDRAKYSLYGPLAAAPLWYLGEATGYPAQTVWMFNRVILLATAGALWLVLRRAVPHVELVRFTAFLFFGTMLPWHVMGFFAETFHLTCVGLGLAVLAIRRDRWTVAGGALAVWGTANVPASSVGLALAACVLAWHHRRLRYLLLPVLAAALILIENALRRGDPLANGYEGEAGNRTVMPYSGLPGFSYPLFFGLLAIIFSFGKGLLFFTPGLFARYPEGTAPREADARLVYRVWLAVVVGLVLVYARWWAWYGGMVWGPRFFLFASLPASLVLARWTARADEHSTAANLFVLLATALACWVGANGLVYQEHGGERFLENNFEMEFLTWFVPEYSVLWMPFVIPKPLGAIERLRLASFALGFTYLAWPVARTLAVRFWIAIDRAWRAIRVGPRWRF